MHPNYFIKNFSEEHALESSSNEIEHRCIRAYERQRKRDVLQYLP